MVDEYRTTETDWSKVYGFLINTAANAGIFVSLMYGVQSVNQADTKHVVYAGLAFLVCTTAKYVSNALRENDRNQMLINHLERILKQKQGKQIKVSPEGEDPLSRRLKKETEKEGIDT